MVCLRPFSGAALGTVSAAAVLLTSCQVPADLALSAADEFPPPAAILVERPSAGYESAGWEERVSLLAESGGTPGLRDTYTRVKTNRKVLAITFDDGPHKDNTPRLLDMLKERKIRATFYVVGNMVKYNPQLLRRMIAEGHEIGNHTVTHGTLSRMSNSGLRKEMEGAHRAIVEATGIAPRTMRPPGGAIKSEQKKWMLKEFGYPTILWSVDPEDWKRPGAAVVTRRLVNGAAPGGILLVHDLHKPTVDAMPSTLDQLLAKGYEFVTVTELLAMDESGAE